ncbi:MAG: hypothetical protein AMJ78_06960 [Omnitrophica WOR_2 bacterium SM23_29]|nr:MAG: hypothetical protein AMJ78_06960 [Omnitrophica WOR_2 bacterium SM23_29]
MKRLTVLTLLFLSFVILQSFVTPQAFAQQKKKPKEIILSTVDIDEDYEILGIVSTRSGEISLSAINQKLKEEAKNLGADHVIVVRYFQYSGYIYAYGTAVKIK